LSKANTHLFRRAFAALLDYGLLLCLTILVFKLQPWFEADETGNWGAGGFVLLAPMVVVWFVYFVVVEARFAQTAGKGLVDLYVERIDGTPLRLADCFKRHLLDLVEFPFACVPGVVAMAAVKITPAGQRLGDMLAGTRVVFRKRAGGADAGS
jgi:uncharacterized RDD family membrane protein YckC